MMIAVGIYNDVCQSWKGLSAKMALLVLPHITIGGVAYNITGISSGTYPLRIRHSTGYRLLARFPIFFTNPNGTSR